MTKATNSQLRKSALDYARLGWHIFPLYPILDGQCTCGAGAECENPGEHSAIEEGPAGATTDSRPINRWWQDMPNAGIGLATGRRSRVVALVAYGDAGRKALEKLEAEHVQLKTPRFQRDQNTILLFKVQDGQSVPSEWNGGGEDIDLLGEECWIALPQSSDLSDQQTSWEVTPDLFAPAPLPDWLLELAVDGHHPCSTATSDLAAETDTVNVQVAVTDDAEQAQDADGSPFPAPAAAPPTETKSGPGHPNSSFETRKVADLQPHPENARIYGDGADEKLVESIKAKGVLQALLVTWDNRVIGGHRRLQAAKQAGLVEVPVVVFGSRDELDITEALVESNRQRVKTNEQLSREAQTLMRIEEARGKLRQQQAGKVHGRGKKLVENVPPANGGKARDQVGAALGVSGKHAAKAATVANTIDDLKQKGQVQEAEQLRKTLNDKSVDAAYRKVRGADEPTSRALVKRKPGRQADGEASLPPAAVAKPGPGTDEMTIRVTAAPAVIAQQLFDRLGKEKVHKVVRELQKLVKTAAPKQTAVRSRQPSST